MMTMMWRITFAAIALLLSAMAVSAADEVEIRGPVVSAMDGAVYTFGPQEFAGFYYDPDDNMGYESITLSITGDVLDEPDGIIYETVAQVDDFEFAEWGQYMTIGFFAENYFAAYVEDEDDPLAAYLADDSTDVNLMVDEQLSKVLRDEDMVRTISSDTPLMLEEGFELIVKSFEISTGRVYLELQKDGTVVDRSRVEPSKEGADIADKSYTYTADLGDTEDIVIIAVHFKNAFRDNGKDFVTVDGIWQISDTTTDIEEDTEYDKMTIQTVNAEDYSIMMNNEDNKIDLGANKDILLMENITIKTADQEGISAESPLRFYISKMITDPGTYEIRGTVTTVEDGSIFEWDATNFAGFYYNIDNNLGAEKLTMTIYGDVLDEPYGVVYTADAQIGDFKCSDWGTFYSMAFIGQPYFAGYINEQDGTREDILDEAATSNLLASGLLSEILVDNGTPMVIESGKTVELAEGYALRPQIGIDEEGFFVELLQNGAVIDQMAVLPPFTYVYTADLGEAQGVPIIAAHFQEPVSIGDASYCKIDGLWQISASPISIEEDTIYDKMTVASVDSNSMRIVMNNEHNKITLSKNKDASLMGDLRIKTADQGYITAEQPLRFYIYRTITVPGSREEI